MPATAKWITSRLLIIGQFSDLPALRVFTKHTAKDSIGFRDASRLHAKVTLFRTNYQRRW